MEMKDMIGKTIASYRVSRKASMSGFFFKETTLVFTDGTEITLESR